MFIELVSGIKYPKITTMGFILKRSFVDVLSSCRSFLLFFIAFFVTLFLYIFCEFCLEFFVCTLGEILYQSPPSSYM